MTPLDPNQPPNRTRQTRSGPGRAITTGSGIRQRRDCVSGDSEAAFPIVGLGASAGGLAAFGDFLSALPDSPGMAFVLVQHLAPDQPSMLTELLQRRTALPVLEIEDGVLVQPDAVYVIPPNRDLTLEGGRLRLLEPASPRGHRLPIDSFFRSLAQVGDRAVCIVFSGTGSDGTLGLRAIKAEGGMVMAQAPESAEHDSMPSSAIATGVVDSVLAPAEMPTHLMAYLSRTLAPRTGPPAVTETENFRGIFKLLRAHTGHDFSGYKRSTLTRRIERRIAVRQVEGLEDYTSLLEREPAEIEALFRDLLIGVTSFFRDPEAFRVLETHVLPRIFSNKASGGSVRAWIPGCSTGEEAYSIAILLQECLEAFKLNLKLQVFATDIDRHAVEQARSGLFPSTVAADISSERLARFFVLEPDGAHYRIQKGIRDTLIFSVQDLLADPPFSNLDLLSCRNLLIYLNADLHKQLIPLFHYALTPGGYLFLGSSETVGDFQALFGPVDRESKLYRRRENPQGAWRSPPGISFVPRNRGADQPAGKGSAGTRPPLREAMDKALLDYAPAAALINERGDILYVHKRIGRYLEPGPGEATLNILKLAREGLHRELTNALRKAVSSQLPVECPGLKVKVNGDFLTLNLTVAPLTSAGLLLVVFEEPLTLTAAHSAEAGPDADERLAALSRELRANEEYLETTLQEMETANEELRSSHEEMQSVNEELQSANEELQTSKEELQSVNEELATVNAELQSKVFDLFRANNDLNNLMAGTGVATIFVDHQLRIQRFTPAVTQVINLIPADIGRPVGHITPNLVGYENLAADLHRVLDTLQPAEVEVETRAGDWFLLRIRPYRTLENVIEGAVILFFDITELKRTEAALRASEAKYRDLSEKLAYDARHGGPPPESLQ